MGETKHGPRSISGPLLDLSQFEDLEDLLPGTVPAIGTVVAEKYRIERLIARGGMGAVFAATHLVSGKRVALKWMLQTLGQIPGARERFIGEACATARIDHPNIVDIYDIGNDSGSVYLVMEYLHGETLSDRLEREPIETPEAIALLMPALRGVAAAHAHGVIHRDLKPDNIFLCRTAEGEPLEPKVLDFGISKISDADSRDHSLTRSGAVLGTPYYMSPEQVRGARDVDERADVYAFGVMLYEALSGTRPFDAETYNQLILKIATETAVPLASLNATLDPDLVAIIERCMAREPSTRFPNIESLALALEPFAGGVRFRSSASLLGQSRSSLPAPRHVFSSPLLVVAPLPPIPTGMLSGPRSPSPLHKRARTTVTSAAVALVLCSAGFWWLHAQRTAREQDAFDKSALAHRVHPAAARATFTPEPALPSPAQIPALQMPAPSERVETTTNAARTPASEFGARPRKTQPAKAHANIANAHAASAQLMREALIKENAPPPSAAKRPTLDWDDRLSLAPAHQSGAPAGRIDSHDFH